VTANLAKCRYLLTSCFTAFHSEKVKVNLLTSYKSISNPHVDKGKGKVVPAL